MKKILTAIALIVCLVLPLSAMAMSTIADNELSAVTGQAGVSIDLDVNMDVTFDIIAWGDNDGFGTTYNNPGWVGITGDIIGLSLKAREDIGVAMSTLTVSALDATEQGTYRGVINAALGTTFGNWADVMGAAATNLQVAQAVVVLSNQFLTIDVGSNSANTQTRVRIGLPTLQLSIGDATNFSVGLTGSVAGQPNTPDTVTQSLGSINFKDFKVLLARNGYIDIYAHAGQGITMDIAANIDSIQGNVAWGDSDGYGAVQTVSGALAAGYVGLKNMALNDIYTDLNVTIDVATALASDGTGGALVEKLNKIMLLKSLAGQCSGTYVVLGINGDINMNKVYAQIGLGNSTALSSTLGSVYFKNVNVAIGTAATAATQSWVTINAH